MRSLFENPLSSFHICIPPTSTKCWTLFSSVIACLFNFIHFHFALIHYNVHHICNYNIFFFFFFSIIFHAAQRHLQGSTVFICVSSNSARKCCCYFAAFATIFGSPQFASTLAKTEAPQPKQPQLPPDKAGSPTKRIVHSAVQKQKLNQYNEALKHNEQFSDQLLTDQPIELPNVIINVDAIVNNLSTPPKQHF